MTADRATATSEQLEAAAQVTPQDLADGQAFWAFWGTPLFRALLDAKVEPQRDG